MVTNRYYIPSYGADHDAIKVGLSWLIESSNETLVFYVPTLRQIDSGTVVTTILGESLAKQFRKDGQLSFESKTIRLITSKKMEHQPPPVRLLAIWADSDSLKKMESRYTISNLLVITWNSKTDIEEWKKIHHPTQFQGYTPKPAPEGDF